MATAHKIWSVDEVKNLIETNNDMVEKSLVKLFERQTTDEQTAEVTSHLNRKGFNQADAKFGCSLAKVVKRGFHLSPKQLEHGRKMLKKYAGQLTLVANEGKQTSAIAPVIQANFEF